MAFCSRDLDLNPMTLIYEPDLDILKMCLHAKKMKFPSQGSQKLEHTHRQTDATEHITISHIGEWQ